TAARLHHAGDAERIPQRLPAPQLQQEILLRAIGVMLALEQPVRSIDERKSLCLQGFTPRRDGGCAMQRPRRDVSAVRSEAAVQAMACLLMRLRELMVRKQFFARVAEPGHWTPPWRTPLIICQ